ncbi:MAG: phospho-N-acetylmuramoyl-pentapeptide-transferase [Clostridia bacterium]|nr:phospho-N-acetylmuramoyl-pentapeptide-transferase [Clostridia bacterium]
MSYYALLIIFTLILAITAVIESRLVPLLSARARQPIYEDGPSWHIKKSGTPTMGGLAFVISISAVLTFYAIFLIHSRRETESGLNILITVIFAIANSAVGVFDDIMKLYRKKNAGLTPMQKLGLQAIISVIFLMARQHFLSDGTMIDFLFGDVDLGIFYYPACIFLLLGIINCANLTDGIDGLATSVAIAIGVAFILLAAPNLSAAIFISASLIGGAIAFLYFNSHPARIFMGDTGSLFLGALTVGIAFTINKPLSIIPMGAVYVIEGISVILQVISFKLTGRRIFKMAPLHHHLEKCGIDENRICVLAVILTAVASCLVIFF